MSGTEFFLLSEAPDQEVELETSPEEHTYSKPTDAQIYHYAMPMNPGTTSINPDTITINSGTIPINPGTTSINPGTITMNTDPIPLNSDKIPLNLSTIPVNPDKIPVNPGQIPMNPGQIPMNPGQIPMNPGQIPMNPGKIDPLTLDKIPTNLDNIPMNQVPLNLSTIPMNPGQISMNSDKIPLNTDKIAIQRSRNLVDIPMNPGSTSKTCYAMGCSNSDYTLMRFRKTMCELHEVPHYYERCVCKEPFEWFAFPVDPDRLHLWLRQFSTVENMALKRYNCTEVRKPKKQQFVCSVHFIDDYPTERHPLPEFRLVQDQKTQKSYHCYYEDKKLRPAEGEYVKVDRVRQKKVKVPTKTPITKRNLGSESVPFPRKRIKLELDGAAGTGNVNVLQQITVDGLFRNKDFSMQTHTTGGMVLYLKPQDNVNKTPSSTYTNNPVTGSKPFPQSVPKNSGRNTSNTNTSNTSNSSNNLPFPSAEEKNIQFVVKSLNNQIATERAKEMYPSQIPHPASKPLVIPPWARKAPPLSHQKSSKLRKPTPSSVENSAKLMQPAPISVGNSAKSMKPATKSVENGAKSIKTAPVHHLSDDNSGKSQLVIKHFSTLWNVAKFTVFVLVASIKTLKKTIQTVKMERDSLHQKFWDLQQDYTELKNTVELLEEKVKTQELELEKGQSCGISTSSSDSFLKQENEALRAENEQLKLKLENRELKNTVESLEEKVKVHFEKEHPGEISTPSESQFKQDNEKVRSENEQLKSQIERLKQKLMATQNDTSQSDLMMGLDDL